MKYLLCLFAILAVLSCTVKKVTDYATAKQAQDYTVPLAGDMFNGEKQNALFIFPHPDDEVVCGGTITYLTSKGAEVNLLTLTTGHKPDKQTRQNEWKKAAASFDFSHSQLLDMPNNSWEDVTNNNITFWYEHADSIENTIYRAIMQYMPTVLFTYDTVLGGYGHHEHRLTALAAYHVFTKHKNEAGFPVKKIYQITLPEKLESFMLGPVDNYKKAMAAAGGKNLPEPTIAVDITHYWHGKRAAAACYPSQNNSLTKFYLLPDEADTAKHYQAFDREYYVELK